MSEGYLMIDHRASPGISEAMARQTGLPSRGVREGGFLEIKTKSCRHCGTVSVLNPERTRERHSCLKCGNEYICDVCAAHTAQPNYVHRSFVQIADMVRSGRFAFSGSLSAPIFTSIKEI